MLFPRSVSVRRAGAAGPKTRFWFAAGNAIAVVKALLRALPD